MTKLISRIVLILLLIQGPISYAKDKNNVTPSENMYVWKNVEIDFPSSWTLRSQKSPDSYRNIMLTKGVNDSNYIRIIINIIPTDSPVGKYIIDNLKASTAENRDHAFLNSEIFDKSRLTFFPNASKQYAYQFFSSQIVSFRVTQDRIGIKPEGDNLVVENTFFTHKYGNFILGMVVIKNDKALSKIPTEMGTISKEAAKILSTMRVIDNNKDKKKKKK